MTPVTLAPLSGPGREWAQTLVTRHHYLHRPVDPRSTPEMFAVVLPHVKTGDVLGLPRGGVGVLIVGRPEATRCGTWYGSVEDAASGRCDCTRWQVLNLARVWLCPDVQPGGKLHSPDHLPGFTDRKKLFRSTLGTTAIAALRDAVVREYLIRRPPCFLDEPYALRWLLSYCDTRLHRGALYRAADAELYRTAKHIQTWRWPLRPLTPAEDAEVRQASALSPRSRGYRDRRTQTHLDLTHA